MSQTLLPPKAAVTACRCHPTATRLRRTWLILLLAVHISGSSCFKLSQAASNISVKIRMEPKYALVGKDISLIPGGTKTGIVSCSWYRGEKTFPLQILTYRPRNATLEYREGYSGRESVSEACALHIRHLGLGDSDFYSVHKATANFSEVGVLPIVVQDDPIGPRAVTPAATAGIVAGCFLGLAFLLGLFSYQTARTFSSGSEYPREIAISPKEIKEEHLPRQKAHSMVPDEGHLPRQKAHSIVPEEEHLPRQKAHSMVPE